jgi:hypothetical protein
MTSVRDAMGNSRPSPGRPSAHMGQPAPVPHDSAGADLRNQIVDRLRRMNALHLQHAWETRRRDPVAPHALVFFYADLAGQRPLRYRLACATRMFLAGEEVRDLPRLIFELVGIATAYRDQGGFEARAHMATRVEPMSPDAQYVGLGVSSLDTPTGTWEQVLETGAGPTRIPGRCLAFLSDGAMILCDRRGTDEYGAFHVWSTHSLDLVWGVPVRAWRWGSHLPELADPATADTWRWLVQLHQLAAGDHAA